MPKACPLIHAVEINLPALPTALDGMHIAHLSDLHVRRHRPLYDRVLRQLSARRLDLVCLTGDYIDDEGYEDAGMAIMTRLCSELRPRLGFFGVFGNHDTDEFRHRARQLPVRWLDNACVPVGDLPLVLLGGDNRGDGTPDGGLLAERLGEAAVQPSHDPGRAVRLLLCHFPDYLPTAVELGTDLMLAGHTHGGQCRLPGRHPLVNHVQLPLGQTAGILRCRDTLACTSRGIGASGIQLRIFCPPQVPIYTLHRGRMPGRGGLDIQTIERW
jgi:predicted MPP superfamily phosphohydrolase